MNQTILRMEDERNTLRAARQDQAGTIEQLTAANETLGAQVSDSGGGQMAFENRMCLSTIMGNAIAHMGDPNVSDKKKCASASCDAYEALLREIKKRVNAELAAVADPIPVPEPTTDAQA